MADRSDLPRAKLGNPSSSSTNFRALGVREEGEVSSGGEDESVLGRAPNLEPSNLSLTSNAEKSTKIGAITTSSLPNLNPVPVPSSNPNLQWVMPQTTPHTYRSKSYNKKMPYNKLPTNRNLSWQKKRPLDDHNLVISFSDDDSESDTTPANVQVRPQMTRSGPTNSTAARNSILGPNASAPRPNAPLQTKASSSQSNGALGSSSDKVLETLRHEIALREKSLKIQKAGSIEATYGRPSKRMKVELPSNGNQSTKEDQLNFSAGPSGYMKGDSNQFLSQQNGDENKSVSAPGGGMVLSKADNGGGENYGRLVLSGVHRSADVSAWLNTNAENTDSQAQLQLLLEQEDAQDRELEQAQELRRRLEREEREAFKAYRKVQRALFEANEKCNLLQKKRDILSNRVNSLVENSSTSNTPWPLCWHDPRESPSDQPADGTRVAGSRNDNREEGQLTDSTNTKDQLEDAATLSDVDKRGSPSGDSSLQDYEALEASLRSELVARYRNKAPLNSTKSAERDAIDQPSTEIQENLYLSPNETHVSPSAWGNNLPSKVFTESTEERMVNQENLFPRDVIDQRSTQTQENISFSPNETQGSPSGPTPVTHSVSVSPSVSDLPSKNFTEPTEERMVNEENLFPRDVIDQRSTQTEENISFSPNETQGSPSRPTPIAHSVSISLSVGGNNLPSKKFTESAEEKLVNQENLFPGDVIDQASTQTQENISFSPNETQGPPSGPTPVAHYVSVSPSVSDLPSKNFTEPTEERMVNEENLFPRDVIDQRSTQTEENISFSPNETQGSPSRPTPIAHSVSISLSVGGNNLPSKKFTESAEEKLVNQENLFPGDVIDQASTQTQENISFSPNETQGPPSGPTPIAHYVSIFPSVGGNDLPSKNFTESAEEKLVNQENLPFGEPQENITQSTNSSRELPLPVNVSISNSTSVSFTESNQTLLTSVKETGEIITHTSLKTTSELAVSHFVLPPSTVRNACIHFKQMVNSSDDTHDTRYEGMNIVNKSERAREDTGVWGPQLDPFWPFCIFELRGRCNDEECHWQHVKDYEWRKFKPDNSLTSPSGLYQHVVHVPTHQIGSCLIKDGPYMACSVQAQGLWQHWQRGFCALFPVPVSVKRLLPTDASCLLFPEASVAHQYNEISSLKLLLEEDLPEAEKCVELALNSSLGKQKVLSVLSRALERDPKSVLIWIVYLHIYYMKEKDLGKDDMFLEAVHNNKYSYDLWLLYINSRQKLEDQLSAFTDALTTMCQLGPTSEKEKKDQSSIILDLYLHMLNTLCMSDRTEMAISRVIKYSSDELLTTILSSLIVPDKCIFWVTTIFLSTYGRLPEGILEQFQLDKDLCFVIDWPSVSLRTTDEFRVVLRLFNYAFIDIGLTEMDPNSPITDGEYLEELHFLALSHFKCKAAIQGTYGATDLLVKYKKIFPNCVELALISARLGENATCTYNSNQGVVGNGFEAAISDWPRQFQGFQCIWNQYAQHFLASKRFDVTRHLLSRWYGDAKSEPFIDAKSESNDSIPRKEHLFGLLNLCLYQLMQDDLQAAHCAVDKALKLTDQEFYMHCLKEHVSVYLLKESLVNQTDISSQVVLDLIGVYLRDARTRPVRKVLSRKFYQDIKETRTRQLLDKWLGPVSDDYSLINSILEMCYGELLIPEKSGIKELVSLVESVTQISPANYRFALSVCRFVIKRFGFDDIGTMSVRFWTGSVLVNSIFQSVPVAPEPIWVEGAEVLVNIKLFEISNRFLEHAVSVYPFSLKLWQSYLSLSKGMNESGDRIVEAAKKRGIELST